MIDNQNNANLDQLVGVSSQRKRRFSKLEKDKLIGSAIPTAVATVLNLPSMELKLSCWFLGPFEKVVERQQNAAPREPNEKDGANIQERVHTNQES